MTNLKNKVKKRISDKCYTKKNVTIDLKEKERESDISV